jgi:hypothetical protein
VSSCLLELIERVEMRDHGLSVTVKLLAPCLDCPIFCTS